MNIVQTELALREREKLIRLAKSLQISRKPISLPITRTDRSRPLPLSFAQQRLWFLAQMEGGREAYHMPFGLRLSGQLDRAALRRALDGIVARQESLRTTFRVVDGAPIQLIAPAEESGFALVEKDLREQADPEAQLERLMAEETAGRFDLERGPLIRGRLIQLADQEHWLLISMHHIVSDGWSMGVLFQELSALYGAYVRGREDPLPELTVQYADYAVWQRQWLTGEAVAEQVEFWRKNLAGAAEVLELPWDRPRPVRQSYAGGAVEVVLSEELTAGLKQLSRRHGTTLYMTLLAGWAVLLARLSGQQDVVIGSPVANRGRVEIENLIGFFVNTLALRVDVSGRPTVAEMLARVKQHAIAAQQHQDLPFEEVVELLQPARSLAHSPVFQVMFSWQEGSESLPRMPGLEAVPVPSLPHVVAKFDLTLGLEETGGSIQGAIEYASALFQAETVGRYAGYFKGLLAGMVRDDQQAVAGLPMLSEAERRQVLYSWNDTAVKFPTGLCVHELFEQQVEKTPDAVALVYGEKALSYAELNAQANRLARHLRNAELQPDDRVGICLHRGLDMPIALLAVMKAGAAYVPLDPEYPAERLKYMVEHSAPALLLTQHYLHERLAGLDERLRVIDLTADAQGWRHLSDKNLHLVGLDPSHLAYVIYTSGSTGTPKGVMNQHRGVVNRLIWMQRAYGLSAQDAVLQKTPFSFDVSVWEFFWPMLAGARLVMARSEGHKDPGYLVDSIRRHNITTLHFVPPMLQLFLEHEEAARCATLLRIISSGQALPPRLAATVTGGLAHVELHNLYGPTEAAVDVTAWTCPKQTVPSIIPIGAPIANTRMYVLDREQSPVGPGMLGQLYIGGVQVARGYLKRPELTAEQFVPDRFANEPGARIYKTGDLDGGGPTERLSIRDAMIFR